MLAPRHLDLLDVEMLVGVHEADRGADAAAITVGRDDRHLVAGFVERGREQVQPRRLDPVVVGYEDSRHVWQCSPSLGGTSRAGLRSKNPNGISTNPVYSTGITGQSSGRTKCVTPNE